MKTMTCKQLGGACDQELTANSWEEMIELSKNHGMEMFQKQDAAHMQAIQEVMARMADPVVMQAWMDEKKALYDSLPDA